MYQLRFLIGSPRRNAPHIFNHRDYRGQRTQPDPLHPDYMTYVCAPTPTLSSHGVMLLLMENAIQHQPNSRLLPIVELYNEQTGDRMPLNGDEIVLRREDLEAAKRAVEASQPEPPAATEQGALESMINAYKDAPNGSSVVFTTMATLDDRQPPEKFLKALRDFSITHPAAVIGEPEPHTNMFGKVNLYTVKVSKPEANPTEQKTPQEPPAPTLLERIKEAIAAGNKTAVMLSNELSVSSDAIKDAVGAEGSGLQNKGGWIKPLATE